MKTTLALLGLVITAGAASAQPYHPHIFSQFSRERRSALGSEKVTIDGKSWTIEITKRHKNKVEPARTATLTQEQYLAMRRALQQARYSDLPQHLPSPPGLAGGTLFTYELRGGTQAGTVQGATGFAGLFQPRLDMIDAMVDAIAASVPPGAAFDALEYSKKRWLGGKQKALQLFADGRLTIEQSSNGGPGSVASLTQGQATAQELSAIQQAVRAARLGSIPAQLPKPVHVVPGDSFSLSAAGSEAALAGATAGEPGFYGDYDARLRPLIDALDALVDRVLDGGNGTPPAPAPNRIAGMLRVMQPGGVFLDTKPGRSFRLEGDLADGLARFAGRRAEVEGHSVGMIGGLIGVTPTSGPLPALLSRFRVERVISPVRLDDARLFVLADGKLRLFNGGTAQNGGPAAEVISRLGSGRILQVSGWLFGGSLNAQPGEPGLPAELDAESVAGRTRTFCQLRSESGAWLRNLGGHHPLRVLALVGDRALVEVDGQRGFLRINWIEVGSVPTPLDAAAVTAPPAHSNGFVSAVPE